ncbi:MAG: hypothetical protein CR984_03775 [Proteobacteria bacterium]|nr:MAG: hypothetical protein CR984_03775 [Pseudomonadota bacterium]PIE67457.1 MAG: hypothetical protein CSA23_04215 [Deltaproteobacteria bacterium]
MVYQINRFTAKLAFVVLLAIGMAFVPMAAYSADVDVYAEGAYTDTDLVIYLYADINAEPILSFGVKVDYPAGLTLTGATKNEAVWYFGDGTTNEPYMDPEDDGSGVVIIGGKLDTADPVAGVTGTRVLLGTVEFSHSNVTDFSGVTISYGRGDGTGDYKNFVGTDGAVKDGAGVGFAIEIRKNGDATGDGYVTSADMFKIRSDLGGAYTIWSDCNMDGYVTSADMFCVRGKL